MRSHMALSVGEPVKNLDTSELKDSKALTPQIVKTTPATSNAAEMPLFMRAPCSALLQSDLRPPARRNTMRTRATTSKMWTTPPMV